MIHSNPQEQRRSSSEIAFDLKNYLFELANIVVRENDFLDQHQIDEVLRIIPIKLDILEKIEAFEAELRVNSVFKELDADTKNTLITTHQDLCELLNINHSKLEVAKRINHQIIDMISEHMINSKRQEQVYNAGGEVVSKSSEHKFMPPLTLNQKI
jgi:hypothetical protein